jgi:NhaP-type Na+/H+ and K+/H+ antiporter
MMFSFRNINSEFFKLCGILLLIIILLRMISAEMTVRMYPGKKADKLLITLMLPRGLASAVLATLPVSAGVPGTESFAGITFGVIIVSNIILTIGMYFCGTCNQTVENQVS